MKKSLFSNDGRILEKNDQTPVTIADFGVQALVSLGNFSFQFFFFWVEAFLYSCEDVVLAYSYCLMRLCISTD